MRRIVRVQVCQRMLVIDTDEEKKKKDHRQREFKGSPAETLSPGDQHQFQEKVPRKIWGVLKVKTKDANLLWQPHQNDMPSFLISRFASEEEASFSRGD